MAQGEIATEFRRNEKVKALDDLPGVPKGTVGRVELVNGFTWTRYRVAFENGADLGSIDGSHLSRPKQFSAALALREQAVVVDDSSANGESDEAVAVAGGDDKVVNGVNVPAHLLERSQRARARLAA